MVKMQSLEIKDKVSHILEEVRVILPGTQALLGFQLATIFSNSFDKIPQILRYYHLVSLVFLAMATLFLMSPAAYHQIVDDGHDSLALHRYGVTMILLAMAALAIGLSIDLYIVFTIITHNVILSIGSGVVCGIVFFAFWFGLNIFRKKRR